MFNSKGALRHLNLWVAICQVTNPDKWSCIYGTDGGLSRSGGELFIWYMELYYVLVYKLTRYTIYLYFYEYNASIKSFKSILSREIIRGRTITEF